MVGWYRFHCKCVDVVVNAHHTSAPSQHTFHMSECAACVCVLLCVCVLVCMPVRVCKHLRDCVRSRTSIYTIRPMI